MSARAIYTFLLPLLLVMSPAVLSAQETKKDSGKEKIGQIRATIYYGTNDAVPELGNNAKPLPDSQVKRLQAIETTKFKNYRMLGQDAQSVLRSYENWVSPLKPSEEIMLSFESRGRSDNGGLRLDLELWQHKRKVMKSDPVLFKGRPLLILGPKWRGGRLIISIELIKLTSP
ncbi:hypothetical protein NT6N_25540 [Oceaniferula spumae]|uniref:Uncharacterized protein n=1 Tax=Oceaniferula spumae TaxID=2979115 RepID=A0AAT9FNI8_9BACT